MDLALIAVAAAKYVVPYLLKLKDKTGEAVGKKAGEFVVDKTVEAAQGVWDTLTGWYKDDQKFIKLSEYLKEDPQDETSQTLVAGELAKRLNEEQAKELQQLLGGGDAVNSIIAGEEAIVERVRQSIKGSGKNVLNLDKKAKASDITQEISN